MPLTVKKSIALGKARYSVQVACVHLEMQGLRHVEDHGMQPFPFAHEPHDIGYPNAPLSNNSSPCRIAELGVPERRALHRLVRPCKPLQGSPDSVWAGVDGRVERTCNPCRARTKTTGRCRWSGTVHFRGTGTGKRGQARIPQVDYPHPLLLHRCDTVVKPAPQPDCSPVETRV